MKRKSIFSALSPGLLALVLVGIVAFTTSSQQTAVLGVNMQAANVDLDQWANKPAQGWQNGNLNGSNSAYSEGSVVPFRLPIEGLSDVSPGNNQHTIHINYDFTSGGNEAYDFLATYNDSESPGLCASGGGGVSSMCAGGLPSPSTMPFVSDTFAPGGTTKAGLTVAGAETYAGVGRNLTMYGGSIVSISTPTHSGSTSSDSTGDVLVTFNTGSCTTDCPVLFAWGGHLAQSGYWKTTSDGPNGSSQITGAQWHMRTLNLDNGGSANHDRSIMKTALITPTATPTVVPTNTPTVVPTNTPTVVPTNTPTVVPTNTPTVVPTNTPTPTSEATATPTATATEGPSPTPTATATEGPSPNNTPTFTPTPTNTPAPTNTPQPPSSGGGDNRVNLCYEDPSGNWQVARGVNASDYSGYTTQPIPSSGSCPSNQPVVQVAAATPPPAPAVAGSAPPPPPAPPAAPAPQATSVPPTVAPAPPAPTPEVLGEQPAPVPVPAQLPYTGEAEDSANYSGLLAAGLLMSLAGLMVRKGARRTS